MTSLRFRVRAPIRRRLLAGLWLAAFCALAAPAAGRAAEAKVLFGTGLSIDGMTFAPFAFSSNWGGYGAMGTGETAAPSGPASPDPVSRGPDSSGPAARAAASGPAALAAAFTLRTGGAGAAIFSGTGHFAETPDGGVRAEWRVVADRAGHFAEAFVGANLPASLVFGGTAIVDGAEVSIPVARGPKGHLFRAPASRFELRGPDGATILRLALDEPTPLLLQDNRHWNGDGLGIRIFFATGSCEAGREYAVKATFHTGGADGENSDPLALSAAPPVRVVAGPGWIPVAREPWIEPGSALDFTSAIPREAPAGKFGRVVARGGHFEFENLPGVPQRFYGVNICDSANLPETAEEAGRIAANLARMGYNAVRIHHHEKWLVAEDGTSLDPARMAKFDMLVAACVENGLYLTTDLFVSRSHKLPWRALGIDRDGTIPPDDFKALCAFYEPAYSNLCAWARDFFGHVNPHTGRTLAEEPALATLALVNEGNLGNRGGAALRNLPGVKEAWKHWLANSGDCASAAQTALPDNLYSQPAATFLADAETRLYGRLRDFVRDELRCPVPLSNISAWYEPAQYALPRAGFDYIDTHFYVDHPQFLDKPWRQPSLCPNRNPMRGADCGAQDCVWLRQFGKPFCVSEFNYSGPGRYRGVGGIATGTLGALQDWDGIWRFDWAHTRDGIANPSGPIGYFDIVNDPLSLAAERAALCLFLRGDLAPLETEDPLVLDPAALRDQAFGAPRLASLGDNAKAWKSRVGTTFDGNRGPSEASGDNRKTQSAVSIDPVSGTFLIDTPRTCGGFAESGAHVAGTLRFELLEESRNGNSPTSRGGAAAAASVWVSSLDGRPIATSSHLLLTHLTDVQNSGIEYADPDCTILLKWGSLPHLMRNGAADIELTLAASEETATGGAGAVPPSFAVYRLSPSGRRLGEVPAEWNSATGALRFTARTDYAPDAATYLYEIVRE